MRAGPVKFAHSPSGGKYSICCREIWTFLGTLLRISAFPVITQTSLTVGALGHWGSQGKDSHTSRGIVSSFKANSSLSMVWKKRVKHFQLISLLGFNAVAGEHNLRTKTVYVKKALKWNVERYVERELNSQEVNQYLCRRGEVSTRAITRSTNSDMQIQIQPNRRDFKCMKITFLIIIQL